MTTSTSTTWRALFGALLTLIPATLTACDFGGEPPEDVGADGGAVVIEEPCPPGQLLTQPPGHPEGCYFDCSERGFCQGDGLLCEQFNGGAIAICLPEVCQADPRCPPGRVSADLEPHGRGCFIDCSVGHTAVCESWEECTRYDNGTSYCTPAP